MNIEKSKNAKEAIEFFRTLFKGDVVIDGIHVSDELIKEVIQDRLDMIEREIKFNNLDILHHPKRKIQYIINRLEELGIEEQQQYESLSEFELCTDYADDYYEALVNIETAIDSLKEAKIFFEGPNS